MSRARTTLAAGLLAGALACAATVPAAAAKRAGDTWTVAGDTRITISGRGFGHGHGMSQYGAEGAARSGLDYRKIAAFYYPGTAWGTGTGTVTVQITGDTTPRDLVVRARSGLTVRDTAASTRIALPDNGATQWRVVLVKGGGARVDFLTDRWQTWQTLSRAGEFFAGGAPITLVTPGGEHAYRGRLRTAFLLNGSPATVNALGIENYLRGVVPLEIPASWSAAAVQAQAVAARTYAAYGRAHPRSSAYQLCDTWSCQVYGGYDAEHPASDAAVRATTGLVLTSRGAPAFTQFGSSSGGWTAAGSMSYLPAREDPYDDWAGNPVHAWTVRTDGAAVERAWPRIGDLTTITVTARDGNGVWGGRVRSLTLTGSKGKVVVSGDAFRAALGLRSTWFTFRIG